MDYLLAQYAELPRMQAESDAAEAAGVCCRAVQQQQQQQDEQEQLGEQALARA